MKHNRARLCSVLMIACIGVCSAKGSEESFQIYLQNYKQVNGQFTQIISSGQSSNTQFSSGGFWIKKPNKFRWHYSTPYVQQIISNGEKLWVYDEDLEQVTIKDASQSIDSSPLSIILGSTSLDKIFDIVQSVDSDDMQWLKLTAKTDSSNFEFINIGFRSGLISQMILQDNFGQTTRLLFTGVSLYTPVDDEFFKFNVPEEVDVFEEFIQ